VGVFLEAMEGVGRWGRDFFFYFLASMRGNKKGKNVPNVPKVTPYFKHFIEMTYLKNQKKKCFI